MKIICVLDEGVRYGQGNGLFPKVGDIFDGKIGTGGRYYYWDIFFNDQTYHATKDSFMYLCEWREKQINSILED